MGDFFLEIFSLPFFSIIKKRYKSHWNSYNQLIITDKTNDKYSERRFIKKNWTNNELLSDSSCVYACFSGNSEYSLNWSTSDYVDEEPNGPIHNELNQICPVCFPY